MIDAGRRLRGAGFIITLAAMAAAPQAIAQSALIENQARVTGQAAAVLPEEPVGVGGWPKIGFDTVGSVEYARLDPESGPGRGPDFKLRLDSTFLAEFNDALSLDGLFQFKSRKPRPETDPNRDLFINQGAGRREGGKMKELYIRYGDYRAGKFVQDFGRGYALLPGPFAADFVEEPEEGYEPSDMIGVEKIHVFDDESEGWQQLSLSAFMVDRTFLHQSFPYNEGMIHYSEGGVGNTRWPENLMATWDVLNKPVGNWAHLNYQASVVRWGRTAGAQRGEWWTTIGGDLSIPLQATVEDTLRGHYSQLHLYLEAARRDNFEGVAGRARNYLSGSVEYLNGAWVFDLTTTQRWTHDRITPSQDDHLYTASIGYVLPSATVVAMSVADETVRGRQGIYAGIRLTQTLTVCNRCLAKGRYF